MAGHFGYPSDPPATGPGAGSVTSVSVTTANGVSGSVATATSTPAITITLSAITPSSVAVGTNPAATGAVRLANAGYVVSRNAANNADLQVIGVTAGNAILMGGSGFGVDFNNEIVTNLFSLAVSNGITDSIGNVRLIPQNSKSAAYTTVLSDSGKHLLHPSGDANARTFTIDSNANVAYPVGTALTFVNQTSQVLSIAITSDTLTLANTTTTGTRSLAQNGIATALKVTSTIWIISGTGLT